MVMLSLGWWVLTLNTCLSSSVCTRIPLGVKILPENGVNEQKQIGSCNWKVWRKSFVSFRQGLILQLKVLNLDSLSASPDYASPYWLFHQQALSSHIQQGREDLLLTVPSNSLDVLYGWTICGHMDVLISLDVVLGPISRTGSELNFPGVL